MLRAVLATSLVALAVPALAWAPPREANLVARIAFSAAPQAGEIVVVTASVQNRGPDSVLDGTLATTLPEGLTLVGVHPTQGSCTTGARVTCSFGLLGRFNQAFDHVASVRLLARAERAGTFDVATEASAPTAIETIPDNNAATRSVVVGAATGTHARALVKLVSATRRRAVVRITGLGPAPVERVTVNGRPLGTVAPGVERLATVRLATPKRNYSVTVAYAGGAVGIAVRL